MRLHGKLTLTILAFREQFSSLNIKPRLILDENKKKKIIIEN